jgi:hypothetical protein
MTAKVCQWQKLNYFNGLVAVRHVLSLSAIVHDCSPVAAKVFNMLNSLVRSGGCAIARPLVHQLAALLQGVTATVGALNLPQRMS